MAEIKKIGTVIDAATITLNEDEIKALDALAGYGVDQFIALFYKHMGRAYLEPHEAGLRSFLEVVCGCDRMVKSAEECREFLRLEEQDRRTGIWAGEKAARDRISGKAA